MSSGSSSQLADWEELRQPLVEIRAGHKEFESFFSKVFDQLDATLSELVKEKERWQSEYRRREDELKQQAAALEQQRAEVETQQEQIRRQAGQKREQEPASDTAVRQRFEQILEEAREERAALREVLQSTTDQADQLAAVSAELTDARDQLSQVREEIVKQRQQIEAAQAEAARTQLDDDMREKLSLMDLERRALEEERNVLESELETVRNRAAEIAEQFERQKRQTDEEQTHWREEFRRQHRLLERLAGRLAEHELGSGEESLQPPKKAKLHEEAEPREEIGTLQSAGKPQPPNQKTTGDDSALDSVMAQFEMLQKDVARRRIKSSGTT